MTPMEKLRTATGKEFECEYFNSSPNLGRTYVRILNKTISDVAMVFSDPKETVQLYWENLYASQYTKLIAIVPEGNAIRVVLGKE